MFKFKRRYNLLKKNSFTNHLLPTDRYEFSSEDGIKNLPKDSFKLPSSHWSWDSDWYYEESSLDGWEYALDFQAYFHKQFLFTDCVRRRKWLRTRSFESYEILIAIENPSEDQFAIDLAIGGWDMQFCEKGFTSVWCVTNTGQVYFRVDVSHSNVEGTKWRFVESPHNILFLSVSCSSTGHAWFITSDGVIYTRNGIDFNMPYGTGWSKVDSPSSECCTLKQLGVSAKSIWALDSRGNVYYRLGVDSSNKTGTKWALISGQMNSISVSSNGQVWGLSIDENLMCFRENISDDCLEGDKWKTLHLSLIIKNQISVAFEEPLENNFELNNDTTVIKVEQEPELDDDSNHKSIYDEYPNDNQNEQAQETIARVTPIDLDNWIEKLKLADEDSDQSEKSSISSSDKKKFVSLTEVTNSETYIEIITFKYCDASLFNLRELPPNWSKEKSRASSLAHEENDQNNEWKRQIMCELKRRNSTQVAIIDKFVQPSKGSTGTFEMSIQSDEMIFFKNINSTKQHCFMDIVENTHVEVKIFNKNKRSKIREVLKYNLKNIVSVVSFEPLEKVKKSGFSMYLRGFEQEPHIFVTDTIVQASEWITCFNTECSKIWSFNNLEHSLMMTSKFGHLYSGLIDGPNTHFVKQINGFLKSIEMHLNGYILGLGHNGKLWFLSSTDLNKSYLMTDEIDFHVYENQRWNILQGYSSIGLPTDRYHFSDVSGRVKYDMKEFKLPNIGLKWITNWRISFDTPGGVDSQGWQYAVDFPFTYHYMRKPLDFVRRRRWTRRSRIRVHSGFIELPQSHSIATMALDIESDRSIFSQDDSILAWACDIDGNVLCSLLNKKQPTICKWQFVTSSELFSCVTIGVGLKVYGVSESGKVYYRLSVNQSNMFCGKSWSELECKNEFLKMKYLSAGNATLWAIDDNNCLYFRENISKEFPEGTDWSRVSNNIERISVNRLNEAYATHKNGKLLYRLGTNEDYKGTSWMELIDLNLYYVSNRGK